MSLSRFVKNRRESLKQNKGICENLIKISVPLNSLINLLDLGIVFLFINFGLGEEHFFEVWRNFCIANSYFIINV